MTYIRRIRKTLGILFILTAIILTQIPAAKVSADSHSFQLSGDILVKYTGTEKSVSIPNTVKIIGEEAFANNETITEVTFSDNVKEVRYGAFGNCTNLKTVHVNNELEEIHSGAFANCKSLESFTIPEKLKDLGNGVFAGCKKLDSVQISDGNEYFSFDDGVIYSNDKDVLYEMLNGRKDNLYTMPSEVEQIRPYAFWGCDDLWCATLSGNLFEISEYAFSNCSKLTVIEIPYSVRSICLKAFEDCISLEMISVPESVIDIHSTAFDGCYQLKANTVKGSYAYDYFEKMDTSNVSRAEYEDMVEIVHLKVRLENMATENNNKNEENNNKDDENEQESEDVNVNLYDPNALGVTQVVGQDAVVFIDNTKQDVYDGSDYGIEEEEPKEEEPKEETIFDDVIFVTDGKGQAFPKYTVYRNVIANQAYYLDETLTEIELPNVITEIGDFAFARSALTSINIPESVTKIGYGAFYHCDYLEEVNIPNTVTVIEPAAFAETKWIKKWKQYSGEEFLIVGDGILIAYNGDYRNVIIPDDVKTIAANVFENHNEIQSAQLPDSLLYIDEEAFVGCSSLKLITGGKSVKCIGDRAFAECPLSNIRIPASVETVGVGAYTSQAFIIFQGIEIPDITAGISSKRVSNEQYRIDAFNEASFAVVSNSIKKEDIEGSALDPETNGFHGACVSILEEAIGDGRGKVCLRLCTMYPDEEGKVYIPITYEIFGKQYDLVEIDDKSFDFYELTDKWERNPLKEVVIPQGAGLSLPLIPEIELNNTDRDVLPEEGIATEDIVTEDIIPEDIVVEELPQIELSIFANSLKNQEIASASISGVHHQYKLSITESESIAKEFEAAYEELYGETDFARMLGLDIVLTDKQGDISIDKFGNNTMKVILPVPISTNSEFLKMMCMDENGQLEEVLCTIETIDELECIVFEVAHLSPYAIYEFNHSEDTGSGALDDSPDTGDGFEPRIFLCIALLSLGILMVLWRGKKKENSTISR